MGWSAELHRASQKINEYGRIALNEDLLAVLPFSGLEPIKSLKLPG
ncbi:MAG: hypothetical protein OFPII_18690 [Osedax symbiont Rs1]|nr:MAG: hypothetical protein OFPII_18690 [Osedax symbiont Rs1]